MSRIPTTRVGPPDDEVATHVSNIPALRRQVRSFLPLTPGCTLLDVGCGRGEDLIALAQQQSGTGALIGVDVSEASLSEARKSAQGMDQISFHAHDVSNGLPFAKASFDAVLSTNTLEAISDKDAALKEMHRVLRPGGTVVIAHFDWDSQLFDGFDKPAVRSIVHSYADWKQAWMADCDAWMGRRLWRTVASTGLFEGSVRPLILVNTVYAPGEYGWEQAQSFRALSKRRLVASEQVEAFLADLEELNRRGQYFYSINMFVFVGVAR